MKIISLFDEIKTYKNGKLYNKIESIHLTSVSDITGDTGLFIIVLDVDFTSKSLIDLWLLCKDF